MGESIEQPAMSWFWPPVIAEPAAATNDGDETEAEPNNADEAEVETSATNDEVPGGGEQEDEEPAYETAEKLGMLTAYLRTTYCYCHWCGTHYTDTADLQLNCPGETKDDH